MNRWTLRLRVLACAMLVLLATACGSGEPSDEAGTGETTPAPDPAATIRARASAGRAAATATAVGTGMGRAGRPERLPAFATLGLYSANSPFNQPIPADATFDPDSAMMIDGLFASGDEYLLVQVTQFTTPVYFADATTPLSDVSLACGEVWELGTNRLLSVPIPHWAEPASDVSAGDQPPARCGEDSPQDNHMVVIDLDARCEYDLWQARREDGGWAASWGNAISLDSTGVYPRGLSSRGSGFAFLGGVIWPDELVAGHIRHALAFSYPYARAGGPVAPASDSDGTSREPFAIPEGARLQLDPDLDVDALALVPAERTIARALQEYGMYLVDSAGQSGIALYAVDPLSVTGNPYAGVLPDAEFPALRGIPLDRLRVLELPRQDEDFREHLALDSSECARFG